ncbi:MAG: mechanosensitive ion channel family protein [Acidimicrobiia bacterium]|nr:mechanosensitive ion channel family protein [Acidimicrobiia bacterium]
MQIELAADLTDACGDDPTRTCEWVFEQTDSEFLAVAAEWVLERPLRILLILVVAFVVSRLVRRAIRSFTKRLTETTSGDRIQELREKGPGRYLVDHDNEQRLAARSETIAHVLSSVASAVIWSIAALTILGEFDINLAPLLAGAGVAGLAIGFGAQAVVRDFLAGMFMLVEDQFGVGDIIDAGEVTGTVEKLSLRVTTLRDVNGTVWHVPNGEIHRVANLSQLWSRAVLDIDVAYEADLRLAEGVIQRVANDLWDDPEWGGDEIIEPPEVWGVQSLGADGVAIRLVVKTQPSTQFAVERELRLRVKEALEAAGIEIPYPQRTVWIRHQGEHPPTPAPDPSEVPVAPTPRSRQQIIEDLGDGEPVT